MTPFPPFADLLPLPTAAISMALMLCATSVHAYVRGVGFHRRVRRWRPAFRGGIR
jgi:hypothetical protein